MYLIISSDRSQYAESSEEAAKLAGAKPWNWNPLARTAFALNPGDELNVDSDVSIIKLSDVEVDYKGPM